MVFEIAIIVLCILLGVFHFISMRGVWNDIADVIEVMDMLNEQQEKTAKQLNAHKAAVAALRKFVLEQAGAIRQLKAELQELKDHAESETVETKVDLLEQLWQSGLSNILNYDYGQARKAASADEDE